MNYRISWILILFGFTVTVSFGQIPSGYYDPASGLTGSALKAALHNIIDCHTTLSYSAVENALKVTDEDTLNTANVICFYTGWSYPKNIFGPDPDDWNREHVWSKSHGDFGTTPPEGTDLHHLRATDVSVNGKKGNRDFDEGTIHYIDGAGLTYCYYTDPYIWEPRSSVKGDVARMLFYMAVRYEGDNGELDLELVDYINSAPNSEPYYGNLDTLLVWHENDPVDDWERDRNDVIYHSYQDNRNPFIDHPEYVDLIWNGGGGEPVNLIISEVADPGDDYQGRFVEIYNAGISAVDFSTSPVYLCRQANGSSWASVQLTGTIDADGKFTVANNTAFNAVYGITANQYNGLISGNGNDGYFLYYGGDNTSGTLLDAYGVIDEDGTGTPWEYSDSHAVRKRSVTSPNTTWTASEWVILAADVDDMTPAFHKEDIGWQGIFSTAWNTKGNNWNSTNGYIPDASCNVTIPNTVNDPIISSHSACNNLTILSGATLAIQSSSSLIIVEE